ncbi:MAG TPA: hypothetical protein VFV99_31800 [Kofleriaceae bacterium]|nr:hypothetical protein [Kofleriaceae bacterium]
MNAETPARNTGWWRALSDAPPAAILAVGWLVLVVYAYPGQLSWDSLEYLRAARDGFYTDAHPPAMSGLWSLTELFVAGPSGMFLLQSLAFITGLYLAMRKTFPARGAAWSAALLTVFPPILLPMGVVDEYALMVGLLMLGFGALLSIQRRINVLGLVALGFAIAVHPTARVAAFPLVVLLFEWPSRPALRRYTVAVGVWLAMTVLAAGANWALTDLQIGHARAERNLFDIAGVLAYSDADRADADAQRVLAGTGLRIDHMIHAKVRASYAPRDASTLLSGDNAIWELPLAPDTPVPDAQRDAIARAWDNLALGRPLQYLSHRLAVTECVLGILDLEHQAVVVPRYPVAREIMLDAGLATRSSGLQDKMTDAARALVDNTPLFVPWIYLVLGLVLLPFAGRYRDIVALLVSGLAAEATLFVTAVDNSYAQSLWLITCACIALVAVIARKRTWKRRKTTVHT